MSSGGCPAASGGEADEECKKAVLKNCGTPKNLCSKI